MNFFKKLFTKKDNNIQKQETQSLKQPVLGYFVSPRPDGTGLCSDNDCPCPNTKLPPGSGYMYVSQATVDFRKDAKSTDEAYAKMDRVMKQSGVYVVFDQQSVDGILMCEQAVRLRKLDMEIASSDARHWWKTGLIPLRATPSEKLKSPIETNMTKSESGNFIADCLVDFSQKNDTRKYYEYPECAKMINCFNDDKNYTETIKIAEQVIIKYPDWFLGYYWQGKSYQELSKNDKAVEAWQIGITKCLKTASLCEALSNYYIKRNEYHDGMLWLLRCIHIQVKNSYFDSVRPFLTIAYILESWGDHKAFTIFKDYSSKGSHGIIDFDAKGKQETYDLANKLKSQSLKDTVQTVVNKISG